MTGASFPIDECERSKSNNVLHAIFASITYDFAQDLRGETQ
ncbi:hypothetical protein EL18_00794 [Nitratireductor basaltis]|uniref:Uncharacterized protein n=1 Tax=Nitratireductor basaltis TaxID=472175 RepID=A0A084U9Y9_9HYPH|nr:hypothetical protein EL18_00794 [Nitratireductor basaltis]